MQSKSSCVVILGTGGTIAGTAPPGAPDSQYQAAQLAVADLLAGVPGLQEAAGGARIESEQVAQVDSKDMDFTVWQTLLARLRVHLARPEVLGVVVTHGTDTLEETAYFLRRMLVAEKPVALTAAMRPATSAEADGPRHLREAVGAVVQGGWRGVAVVLQGEVHDPCGVRKVHPRALRAFDSGEPGPAAVWRDGTWVWRRPLVEVEEGPRPEVPVADWPWVEVLHSHAGARAAAVDSWVRAGVAGLVVAATGNGTLHRELETGLRRAQAAGVRVWRCTRCTQAGLVPERVDGAETASGLAADGTSALPASDLSPAQARIALMLSLMAGNEKGP